MGDKLNTKELLVVLECLKGDAFDSTDWLRVFVIMPLARSVVECRQRFVGAAWTIWNFRVFSIIRWQCEAIFLQDVAMEGR